MIIFIYGEDTYRARKKLKEIIEGYKKVHKSGFNLKYLDFSEKQVDYNSFKDEIRQTSMFKEKKLVILANSLLNVEFKEAFLKNKKDFLESDDIFVFYEEGAVDKRNTLYKFLEKNTKSQMFDFLDGYKLKKWIEKEFDNHKTKIEPLALEKLIEYVGKNLWQMNNEITKLVNFKKSTKTIQVEDVELLIKSKIETDIFKTIDAIAQKNKKQAIKLLHKHLENGDSPLYILSMINFQFRNLLIIKDLIEKYNPYNVIVKKSKLHPFVVRKSYSQSQQFTLSELKKIYQKIFQVDIDIKTGRVLPETGLDLLVAEL
ncbi:MAG: DNA polymerase III subunit delta [Candidatus Nealsonbacteria bacterium]